MNWSKRIAQRWQDWRRERCIRRIGREVAALVSAAGFLRREADGHMAEARLLHDRFTAELDARSIAQLRRMAAREINRYLRAGEHEFADKLAAGYEEDFAAREDAAAGRGPKSVRVGDLMQQDDNGVWRWKHSGDPLPMVFQPNAASTATNH